jgi:hypothetical protein
VLDAGTGRESFDAQIKFSYIGTLHNTCPSGSNRQHDLQNRHFVEIKNCR